MIILDYHWEQVLSDLVPMISTHSFEVIPSMMELRENNLYTDEYAWMYAFEKKIIAHIENALGRSMPHKIAKLLFSVGGGFSEAMSNAYLHGNKKNRDRKIEVRLAISNTGFGFSIKDEGSGFDFDEVMNQFSKGKPFFHVAGNGFKILNESEHIHSGFTEGGSRLNLVYFF